MRARTGIAATLASLLTIAAAGCESEDRDPQNRGVDPPDDRFFFPSGLLLPPLQQDVPGRNELDEEAPDPMAVELPSTTVELPGAPFLVVANGNNDRTYNAGTLVAVDLQRFWQAWYDPQRDDPAQATCAELLEPGRVTLDKARDDGEFSDAQLAQMRELAAACSARDPRRGGLDPYCHDGDDPDDPDDSATERCVLPPGAPVVVEEDDEGELLPGARPCRRLPLLPHVVECDEAPFVEATVRVGDFASTLAYSDQGEDAWRLWLPVRGDPSITYVDMTVTAEPGAPAEVSLECDPDPQKGNKCGETHVLDALRNDDDLAPLDREPFNVVVWEREPASTDPDARGQRLAFVAHADGTQLSLIDLDGVRGGSRPAIVDLADLYLTTGGSAGGFGLAVRPCFEAGQGPLGPADPEPNVPAITQGCRRPLVYTSFRFAGQLASFTASGLDVGREVETQPGVTRLEVDPQDDRDDDLGCMATDAEGQEFYAGPYCATPDQVGLPCAVECEPKIRGSRRILPSLLLDTSLTVAPILGDMAFADPRGDQLLILQTNPGALLSMDTSLGSDGEPLDIPSAPPVEICAEPSRMKIYQERARDGTPVQRYALISCFRAALVYVVDLEALRVVDAVVVGTGPHDLAIDEAREVAYVINNLESSVSVIDLSRRRSTRFQELARLGLQDPYSQ